MLPDWKGRTVVCIASGPSLTPEDCAVARAAGIPTVVTNTTFRTCPWADALYWFDVDWWREYGPEVRESFAGTVYTQSLSPRKGVQCVLANQKFRSFGNSGACAVALAIAAGASKVVMLGFDCSMERGSHHHGDHPSRLRNCDTIARWPRQFSRLAAWAEKRAVVVNASRMTALECFSRAPLADALRDC